MLTEKEVEHIANLARIKLTEKEEDKFKKELSSILDYINKLNEVNTDNVKPLYQVTGLVNSMRVDENRGEFKMDRDLSEKLIGQAPQKENRFVRVRSVLKR